jgi:hypothetical protein
MHFEIEAFVAGRTVEFFAWVVDADMTLIFVVVLAHFTARFAWLGSCFG